MSNSRELVGSTIPPQGSGIPIGRTALVPGFFAGIEASHERHGGLPFETLFEPAVYFAETGFELTFVIGYLLFEIADVHTRLEETAEVFTRDDGELYTTGDWFTQPALADTLATVAHQGVAFICEGPWAERAGALVRAVHRPTNGTTSMRGS